MEEFDDFWARGWPPLKAIGRRHRRFGGKNQHFGTREVKIGGENGICAGN